MIGSSVSLPSVTNEDIAMLLKDVKKSIQELQNKYEDERKDLKNI